MCGTVKQSGLTGLTSIVRRIAAVGEVGVSVQGHLIRHHSIWSFDDVNFPVGRPSETSSPNARPNLLMMSEKHRAGLEAVTTHTTTPWKVVRIDNPDSAEIVEVRRCQPKLRGIQPYEGHCQRCEY